MQFCRTLPPVKNLIRLLMLTGNMCAISVLSAKRFSLRKEGCEEVAVKVTSLFFPFRKQDFQQEGDEMRCRHKYIDQSHVIYELFFQWSALRIRQGAEPLPQRERGIAPSGQTGIAVALGKHTWSHHRCHPCLGCPHPVVEIAETVTVERVHCPQHLVDSPRDKHEISVEHITIFPDRVRPP